MKQFIYTHHQGGEGKMVEKATMERPEQPGGYSGECSCDDCHDYYVAQRKYQEHISTLITYDARNFSPSDNGKTFNEDQFKLQYRPRGARLVNSKREFTEYPPIAVPLSEKMEERTFTLEEMKDAFAKGWAKGVRGENYLMQTDMNEYFQTKFSINLNKQ